jgi:isoleucyl-tRNA synthetase
MDMSYTESVWWVFSELWKKGLIYEGRKAMHVCPRCVTPLSNFEVTLGYKEVEDLAVTWKFPVVGQENTSLIAWTTTPWSSPGITGLSVGPNFTYIKAQVGDEFVYVVKERAEAVLGAGAYTVVEEVPGTALVGLEFLPLDESYRALPEVVGNANMYHVFAGDYVETTEGTGIVTINGAYGEVDMEAARKNGLPLILDVNMDGLFNEKAGALKGMFVKKGQKQFVEAQAAVGRVFKQEGYKHSYPHCWRCDTALLNYATSSWFVSVTKIKEQLLANNQKINWIPAHIKDGRFGTWLENARDWAISRSRFWGAPLPIWRSEDGETICVSSVQDLEELSRVKVTDLHKHIIDPIVIEKGGKEYRRIPEVLDCWFESGSMPYGQRHYPFENKADFTNHFPAQFISEAQDQTRGWFYTLHVLATALTSGDKPSIPVSESTPAFQNVIVDGIVLAEDGKKMSKKLKNYPDPMGLVERYGADALRLYIANSVLMEGESLNFSEADVDQVSKKYINTLWNVFTFYKMFAEQEKQSITPVTAPSDVTDVMDRWILAKLHQLVADVNTGYESYLMRDATQPLVDFVQELSTWYVRRIRSRVKGEDAADRLNALRTLQTVLKTFSLVAAPITPFIAEKIYQSLRTQQDPESVHHVDWPVSDPAFLNQQITTEMQSVRVVIEQALALRAEAGMKVRQPLQSVTVTGTAISEALQQVICEELNVKEVKFGDAMALDTQLTDELRTEGTLRELVRQTNALRKQSGLSVGQQVKIVITTPSEQIQKALTTFADEYKQSVLATDVQIVAESQAQQMTIDGEEVSISLS